MEISALELDLLKIIQKEKEAFGESSQVAAKLIIPPDYSERICDSLVAKGYLETIGNRKKYRLGKEGENILKAQ